MTNKLQQHEDEVIEKAIKAIENNIILFSGAIDGTSIKSVLVELLASQRKLLVEEIQKLPSYSNPCVNFGHSKHSDICPLCRERILLSDVSNLIQ